MKRNEKKFVKVGRKLRKKIEEEKIGGATSEGKWREKSNER